MPIRTGVVTTLRNAGASLESFVRYHCAIGFDHLYLFFDDPQDADVDRVRSHPRVTVLRHDDALRAAWERTPIFRSMGRFVPREVIARQALNAAVAIQLAQADGIHWLLHIDADELFLCPDGRDIADVFGALEDSGARHATFFNHEVLVDRMTVGDCFKELVHFKRNPRWLSPGDKDMVASIPQFQENYFIGYGNGKSAGRVGPDLQPDGVHRFSTRGGQTFVNDSGAAILHYIDAGLDAFLVSYRTRGAFADSWFGRIPIRSRLPLHVEARDVVALGDLDRAKQFFAQHLLMDDAELIDSLRASGIVLSIHGPSRLLDRC